MATYTFIDELKAIFSSEQLLKKWLIKIAHKKYVYDSDGFAHSNGWCGAIYTFFNYRILLKIGDNRIIELSEISFFDFTFDKYVCVDFPRQKNGIEVLGLRPNAKKTTYSDDCKITVSKLKEACKINGIKCTGLSKTEMMGKLMKV